MMPILPYVLTNAVLKFRSNYLQEISHLNPTNIGIVRGTVSVATIVVVSAGVEIWLL